MTHEMSDNQKGYKQAAREYKALYLEVEPDGCL